MIATVTMLVALAAPQEPAGAGFREASRIYQQVAERPNSGPSTMRSRIETVQARIDDLQQQIERSSQVLVSLERQEMEQTMAIQSAFGGNERDDRLRDLQQSVSTRRVVVEENLKLLDKDLQSARQDLASLQVEYDVVRAMRPESPTSSGGGVEDRVVRYFREKAEQLGLPRMQSLPEYWVRANYRLQ